MLKGIYWGPSTNHNGKLENTGIGGQGLCSVSLPYQGMKSQYSMPTDLDIFIIVDVWSEAIFDQVIRGLLL